MLNISQMATDTAIVTIEGEYETVQVRTTVIMADQ